MHKNALAHMEQFRQAAAHCKSCADYVSFLNERMPVGIEEVNDGIVMYLGKAECSCLMAKELPKNTDMLCECTKGHEEFTWSAFFGRSVEIEIVESIFRGGKDCIIKIKLEEAL